MIRANPKTSWNNVESTPNIASTAYVDEAATIIGDVRIGERVYVAPGASVRADEATPIIIGDECNVQDGAVFHGLEGTNIELGRRVSIAHGAVVHGPLKIGDESFVGFNAVVHASTLGKKCFVGHLALVVGVKLRDGSFVPPGAVVDSQEKAEALGSTPDNLRGFNDEVVGVNTEFADAYRVKAKFCAPL
ncbi:MAG: DapH/DapD/GlmU-related protein [Methanothrix sp.]|jgi:carbonic anhydrase/acetyltransferase-like protein (isoleucine patch superfamily)|uniref:Carbonate dehydratase n=1 Tax=Methanothrix harundinacea TaxID=301375 RepID=A0A117MBS5_9EURY|nr:MAG: Carbonate dehydratase [Methanothrix harundinacea]MDD3709894.1 DapH/DapD/GlmU-related protein [Methanothrix sp.]MDI9399272.1 DapH/DapD/GlmU-related protein [Euryarchaeota archaeon]KUK95259.1 MAG: Carbonate dehydratase [Methanothrix harundinacea]MCP1392962.1 carbonate dehydratase [Methanothrix harundinacea]